jgi:hypothetical protein
MKNLTLQAQKRKPLRRRLISRNTWASISAFTSRERTILTETAPASPRIKTTLARVQWMEREPSTAAA